MRNKLLLASILTTAIAVALPAQAQLLGGGGAVAGGLGGMVNSNVGRGAGSIGGSVAGRASGSLDATGRLDTVGQRAAERAGRLRARTESVVQQATAAVGRVGDTSGMATGSTATYADAAVAAGREGGALMAQGSGGASVSVDGASVARGLDTARERASANGQRGIDVATDAASTARGTARTTANGLRSATTDAVERGRGTAQGALSSTQRVLKASASGSADAAHDDDATGHRPAHASGAARADTRVDARVDASGRDRRASANGDADAQATAHARRR